MKDLMRQSLRFMWPEGCEVRQLRDIIRVYSMGWVDAMMTAGNVAAVEAFRDEYARS